jgi:hypothetical protein
MLRQTAALGLSAALSAAALPALADTHITFVDDQGKVASQIFVKGGKVRVEGGEGGSQSVGLYDSATNSMTVLVPGQKKYLLFDSANVSQLGAQADAAQQAAQAQLAQHQAEMDQANKQMETAEANLTPEQKAMVQQQMVQHPGAMPPATGGGLQVQTKELGTSETVAGHSCKDVQVTVNGRITSTDCVVDSPGALGIPASDLKTLQAMRVGMQKLMSQMGMMGQGMSTMMGTGFAIKSTRQSFRNFKATTVTETFKDASSSPLDASLFQTPAGYTQTTMQELMQGGHQ